MLFLSLIGKLAVREVVVSGVTRYSAKTLLRVRGMHNYSCKSYSCQALDDYNPRNSNRFAYPRNPPLSNVACFVFRQRGN